MSDLTLVLVYSALWAGFGVASGWVASKVPAHRLDHDGPVTRIRRFEHRGRWYDRHLRLRVWKDRLPEAGSWFGGASKATMTSFDHAGLESFATETRRAELVHWANVAFGFTFFAWNGWGIGVVMVVFGTVVHLPFVLVQRYNRARIEYLLDRARVVPPTLGADV